MGLLRPADPCHLVAIGHLETGDKKIGMVLLDQRTASSLPVARPTTSTPMPSSNPPIALSHSGYRSRMTADLLSRIQKIPSPHQLCGPQFEKSRLNLCPSLDRLNP